MVIDRSKPEHAHLPETVEGQVLLEETFHAVTGEKTGVLAIEPEVLKTIAEDFDDEEKTEAGYDRYPDQMAWARAQTGLAKKPMVTPKGRTVGGP